MSDSFDAATTAAGLAWARGCRASRTRNLLMGVAGIVLGKGTDVEMVRVHIGKREDGGRSNASGCCRSASVGSEKPFRCAFRTVCSRYKRIVYNRNSSLDRRFQPAEATLIHILGQSAVCCNENTLYSVCCSDAGTGRPRPVHPRCPSAPRSPRVGDLGEPCNAPSARIDQRSMELARRSAPAHILRSLSEIGHLVESGACMGKE